MLEIQPVSPSLSLVRPKRIDKDDNKRQQNQPRDNNKQQVKTKDQGPMQHIDEIV